MNENEKENGLLFSVLYLLKQGTHGGLDGEEIVNMAQVIEGFRKFVNAVDTGEYVIVQGDAYNALIKGQVEGPSDIGYSDPV